MGIKRRTMAVLGLATIAAAATGGGMAYAAGDTTTVTPAGSSAGSSAGTVSLQAVPGAMPDLSKVAPGTAVPLGIVVHAEGSGTTKAR